jgi:hypothetical protein
LGLGDIIKDKLGIPDKVPLPFDLKLGDASLVFNGPAGGFWLNANAGAENPLAATPFKDLIPSHQASLEVAIFGNGQFFVSFSGEDSITGVPGSHLILNITIDNSGITAELSGGVKWSASGGFSAEATVTGILAISIDANTGKLHYAGSVRASGKVKGFGGSASFDVGAELEDNTLVFDLPIIGRQRITLPS